MLGTSAQKLTYRTIEDFHSPADYLDYMFGGVKGVAYRATIAPYYFQTFYRTSGLIKAKYEDVNHCYVAMNTFYRESGLDLQSGREVRYVKRLNAFYVDIDCYKVGLSKNEVLFRLEDEYIGKKIPVPTFVIDSGRGLYLIWKLRDEDKNALPRWERVEQYLTDTLEELGADQACTDAARILRVPFSYNSKSESNVSILEFNDLTYSIYDISTEYGVTPKKYTVKNRKDKGVVYPYNHATERQRKFVRDIARHLGLSEEEYPDFTNFHETANWIEVHKDVLYANKGNKGYCYKSGNVFSLTEFKSLKGVLGNYCAEIRKLFSLRKGEDCKREIALFLYRYFLREMKVDSESALKQTLAFNASLDCPYPEADVVRLTASADRRIELGIPYAYKKSTIISILEITKEELAELPFFSAKSATSKEKRKERNRRAYESRLAAEGKVAKKDAILSRRAAILAMQGEGKTPAEIQEALQISHATYHRDLVALTVESTLEAAKSVLTEQLDKIEDNVQEAAEIVSDAVVGVKKAVSSGAVCRALKKVSCKVRSLLSHFFSRSIYRQNAEGVPHGSTYPHAVTSGLRFLRRVRGFHRNKGSDSGGSEDDGADMD